MEIDFSSLNLQYLIQVREIARKSPELAVAILGSPVELVNLLASLTTEELRGHLDREGVKPARYPVQAPNCNAFAERFVRSKRGVLEPHDSFR